MPAPPYSARHRHAEQPERRPSAAACRDRTCARGRARGCAAPLRARPSRERSVPGACVPRTARNPSCTPQLHGIPDAHPEPLGRRWRRAPRTRGDRCCRTARRSRPDRCRHRSRRCGRSTARRSSTAARPCPSASRSQDLRSRLVTTLPNRSTRTTRPRSTPVVERRPRQFQQEVVGDRAAERLQLNALRDPRRRGGEAIAPFERPAHGRPRIPPLGELDDALRRRFLEARPSGRRCPARRTSSRRPRPPARGAACRRSGSTTTRKIVPAGKYL